MPSNNDLSMTEELAEHNPLFTAPPNPGFDKADKRSKEFHLPIGWQQRPVGKMPPTPSGGAACMVTGYGLGVVDVDTKNGAKIETEREALQANGVEILAEVRTPSGGAHFYVASTGICSSANPANGVDFRGGAADGSGRGFVYIPGTARPKYDGGGYEWVEQNFELLGELDRDDQRDALWTYLQGRGITPRLTAGAPALTAAGEAVDGEPPAHIAERLGLLTVDDRSAHFHGTVGECKRAGFTQGQTVTLLTPWCESVGKYVGRVACEVARSWPKLDDPQKMPEQVFDVDVSVEDFCNLFPHTVGCEYGSTQLRDYMGRLVMATKLGKRTALLRDTAIPKVFSLIKAGCLGSSAVESLSTWVEDIAKDGGDDVGPVMSLAVANTVAKTSCQVHKKQPEGSDWKQSAATDLVELANEHYEFLVSTDDEAFAVPKQGPKIVRLLRGGRSSLRPELAKLYNRDTGRVPAQQAIADALLVIEGFARECDPVELHNRVAWHQEAIYLDLGDVTGRAVRIGASGWTFVEQSPVLFKRTALTGVIPAPETGGHLDELWKWLNVSDGDRGMLRGYLVAALVPDIPHPVLSLQGEQGTGKSTAARTCVALIDASTVPLRKPPKDGEGWVTAAAGSWVVALDNVSAISAWLSDSICRAVTGDGDVRRKQYSDSDLTVFSFRRVIILNGIDHGALKGDLAERLLVVNLEPIASGERMEDATLVTAWEAAYPRILGALLDLLAEVLTVRPNIHLEESPRMADFAHILAAIDHVDGEVAKKNSRELVGEEVSAEGEGSSLARYLAQGKDLGADSATSEPAVAAMMEKVLEPGNWTSKQLLKLITPDDKPRDWPSPRAFTGLLKRCAPALRGLGWSVDPTDEKRHGAVVWHITPSASTENGEHANHRGEKAGKQPPLPTHQPIHTVEKGEGEVGEVETEPSLVGGSDALRFCSTCALPLEPHLAENGWAMHPPAYGCATVEVTT